MTKIEINKTAWNCPNCNKSITPIMSNASKKITGFICHSCNAHYKTKAYLKSQIKEQKKLNKWM